MTDKEVIKGCDGCPHKIGINHYRRKAQNQKQELRRLNEKVAEQQAEIERSNRSIVIIEQTVEDQSRTIKSQTDLINKLYCNIETARAEAIKEYKNKVENDIVTLLGKSNYFDVFGCLN